MEAAILSNGGVIDKFIGDAIIAVFYPTKENVNSILNACKAALTMRQSLALFNSEREKKGLITIENGVGISHGEIISGNVGESSEYLEFTVTGRPIKKANDLEAASKNGKYTKVIIDSCVAKKASDIYLLAEFEHEKHGLVYEIKNEK
jgi:adenylate cyclase